MAERILIVDDDAGFRGLVADVLEKAGYAVSEASDADEALEAVRRSRPRLVLLDVTLPGTSGYEICRRLRGDFGPELGIVFVSGERCESYDRAAGILLGADDYLVKPVAPDELVARVGRIVERSHGRPGVRVARLTKREIEVLRLLAEGLAQPAIADALVISPKTVGTHIEHILMKLGVSSRAQAVARAYRDRLIEV